MTVVTPETKVEPTSTQEKIDIKISQPVVDSTISQTPEVKETENEDPNWRAFREARKKDRVAREEAERRASQKEAEVAAYKAAMEAAFNKPTPSQGAYNQHYGLQPGFGQQEETEEQLLEKRIQSALDTRIAQMERARQEEERKQFPQKLQQAFPDLSQVCSQDNLDYLDYHYPEVSRPLQRLPDDFDKWADIYKAVKKFVPNNVNAHREAAKAEANFNKPKSISGPQITQTGHHGGSNILSDDRKKNNWERMQKMLKGVG